MTKNRLDIKTKPIMLFRQLIIGGFLIIVSLNSFRSLKAQGLFSNEEKDQYFRREVRLNLNPESGQFVSGYRSLFDSEKFVPERNYRLRLGYHFASVRESEQPYPLYGVDGKRVYYASYFYGAQGLDPGYGESQWITPQIELGGGEFFRAYSKVHLGMNFRNEQPWYGIEELLAEFRFRKLIFDVGRGPMSWGQSFVAPLILSDNAANLNHIRFRTESVQLPYFLRSLGWFSADAFASRLNDNRQPKNDWFVGFRLGWKPVSFLEFNTAGLYQLGGQGVPSNSIDEYFFEFLGARVDYAGDNVDDASDATNRALEFDMRIFLEKWGIPASFYSEHHLEDCCGKDIGYMIKKSYSYILGFFVAPRIGGLDSEFRFEYLRTGNALYFHQRWSSGTSNDSRISGHPLGRDSRGFYFLWKMKFKRISPELYVAYEQRGLTGKVSHTTSVPDSPIADLDPSYIYESAENRWSVGPTIEWKFSEAFRIRFKDIFVYARNKENRSGINDFENSWMVSGSWNF